MSRIMRVLIGVAALGVSAPAWASGPCSDDIAQLARQLGGMPGLGAPISEPVAGESVGRSGAQVGGGTPGASDRAQQGGASLKGGGSPGTVGGVAGPTGAQDAVSSGQVATSDQDVRQQSVGKPTLAQQAARGSHEDSSATDKTSMAKMSLQKAVDLNAQGDGSCMDAVKRTRELMKKS